MTHKPFRFSWQAFDASSASDWRNKARMAEALGYSTFHLCDHYLGPGPALDACQHPIQSIAAVPGIAMAAEATRHIQVGCRVFCTSYRPPAVLAKEVMTLDFLSDGRLEMGLGAGWIEAEYNALGIPFDPVGRRIDRLEETIGLIKVHMADGPMNVQGKYARAVGYEGVPKPVRGKVPIMIGGGAPRVLRLAGREADIVSINFNNRSGMIGADSLVTSTAEETAKKVGWIKEGAGDRFDQLEIEIGAYTAIVTDNQKATVDAMAPALGMTVEDLLAFPHALIGSVDYICEELERRRELYGISYISVQDEAAVAFAPVVAKMTGK